MGEAVVELGLRRAAVLLDRERARVLLARGRRAPVRLGDTPVELGEAVELADAELPDDVRFDRGA